MADGPETSEPVRIERIKKSMRGRGCRGEIVTALAVIAGIAIGTLASIAVGSLLLWLIAWWCWGVDHFPCTGTAGTLVFAVFRLGILVLGIWAGVKAMLYLADLAVGWIA